MAQVAIRVDANYYVGLGHLMRTRTLVQALLKRGHTCHYFCDSVSVNTLISWGIGNDEITFSDDENFPCNDFTHIIADICYSGNNEQTNKFVAKALNSTAKVAVIDSMPPDHFSLTSEYLPRRPDIVITPYHAAEILRVKPCSVEWATGPDYAIMTEKYLNLRKTSKPFSFYKILVSCGGSDPSGLTLRITNALSESKVPVSIVLGPLYESSVIAKLENLAETNSNLTLVQPKIGLEDEIISSSHVVGRVGLIRYETALLGRTGIFLSESLRYREYLKLFSKNFGGKIYFSLDPYGESEFFNCIKNLGQKKCKTGLNTDAMQRIDGKGASRIIDKLGL